MFYFVLQNVQQNLNVDGKQPQGGADGRSRRGAAFPESGQDPRDSVCTRAEWRADVPGSGDKTGTVLLLCPRGSHGGHGT